MKTQDDLDKRIQHTAGKIQIPTEIFSDGVYSEVRVFPSGEGDKDNLRIWGEMPHSEAYNKINKALSELDPYLSKYIIKSSDAPTKDKLENHISKLVSVAKETWESLFSDEARDISKELYRLNRELMMDLKVNSEAMEALVRNMDMSLPSRHRVRDINPNY